MIDVIGVLIVQLGTFVEDFEEVGLEIAALVEHHLRAGLHLLNILLLEPKPGLELANPALKLQLLLLPLPLYVFELTIQSEEIT